MGRKTWIYVIILVVVLAAAGIFFWWNYKSGLVKPKAETPTQLTQTFADVPMGDANNNYEGQYWAFNQIEAVYQKGWMVGWDVKEFRPTENATRAQVAVGLSRAYSKTANPDTPSFSDVPKTYWAYQEIEGLKAAGYISGYDDGTFRPDTQANRGDMAQFFAKAHNGGPVPAYTGQPTFSDCQNVTNCPYYNEIEYLAHLDPPVVQGFGDGTYRPNSPADRQTLAVALSRDKNLDTSNPPATPSFYDVPVGATNYAVIEAVNTAGYMTGYPVKIFQPELVADRATVAVVIARATNNIFDNQGNPSFPDVPKDYWAYKEIEGVNKAGFMTGYPDGYFCPDAQACPDGRAIADRTTIAVVIARAKGLTLEANGTQVFADVPPTQPDGKPTFGYAEINAISKAGYTKGCGQNDAGQPLYCPNQVITRAVLAAFMYNGFILPTPSAPSLPPITPSVVTQTQTQTTTTRTSTAETGAELPLAGAGLLSGLFVVRYLLTRKVKP